MARRRPSRRPKIEAHAAFVLEAIEQQPDPTLAELREMLGKRGVSVGIATLWRFFCLVRPNDRARYGPGPCPDSGTASD